MNDSLGVVKRKSIEVTGLKRALLEEEERLSRVMVDAIRDGHTPREIAKAGVVAPARVYYLLRKAGVKLEGADRARAVVAKRWDGPAKDEDDPADPRADEFDVAELNLREVRVVDEFEVGGRQLVANMVEAALVPLESRDRRMSVLDYARSVQPATGAPKGADGQ